MKTILITGASSGIGKAAAELFASKGWHVIATMRKPPKKNIKNITFEKLDVTKPTAIKKLQKLYPRIDVLVNNAGYGLMGRIDRCTDKEIQQQFDTNIFGVIRMMKAFLPNINNNGIIINISSMVGKFTFPGMGYYNATKHAVEALSEALWHELYNTSIKVKIIEPGLIQTDFFLRSSRGPGKRNREQGSSPLTIAKLIYKAATSKSRKLRYHAGRYSTTLLLARKLLPDWLFLRLIRVR